MEDTPVEVPAPCKILLDTLVSENNETKNVLIKEDVSNCETQVFQDTKHVVIKEEDDSYCGTQVFTKTDGRVSVKSNNTEKDTLVEVPAPCKTLLNTLVSENNETKNVLIKEDVSNCETQVFQETKGRVFVNSNDTEKTDCKDTLNIDPTGNFQLIEKIDDENDGDFEKSDVKNSCDKLVLVSQSPKVICTPVPELVDNSPEIILNEISQNPGSEVKVEENNEECDIKEIEVLNMPEKKESYFLDCKGTFKEISVKDNEPLPPDSKIIHSQEYDTEKPKCGLAQENSFNKMRKLVADYGSETDSDEDCQPLPIPPSVDNPDSVDSESDSETSISSKGEDDINEIIRPVEDLKITVPKEEVQEVGIIQSIIEANVVIAPVSQINPLDLDTILFLDEGQRTLGRIDDVFGPITEPLYVVPFKSSAQIKKRQITPGMKVYYAPHTSHTSYVEVNTLLKEKGSDASWKNNNEVPDEYRDFSDDEEELKSKGLFQPQSQFSVPQKRSWNGGQQSNRGRSTRNQNFQKPSHGPSRAQSFGNWGGPPQNNNFSNSYNSPRTFPPQRGASFNPLVPPPPPPPPPPPSFVPPPSASFVPPPQASFFPPMSNSFVPQQSTPGPSFIPSCSFYPTSPVDTSRPPPNFPNMLHGVNPSIPPFPGPPPMQVSTMPPQMMPNTPMFPNSMPNNTFPPMANTGPPLFNPQSKRF